MKIAILGNGNAGICFYHGLKAAGYQVQIFAREVRESFEKEQNAVFQYQPDLAILAVSDSAIARMSSFLSPLHPDAILVHVSGATPLADLENQKHLFTGVLYPLQTLRKGGETNWSQTPIFVQASNEHIFQVLQEIASALSSKVYPANDDVRLTVHLAGVMTNNFINHLIVMAYDMLNNEHVDPSVLHPILKTTFEKIMKFPPDLIQTGPAIRGDEQTMERHRQLIQDAGTLRIYDAISENIRRYYGHKQ